MVEKAKKAAEDRRKKQNGVKPVKEVADEANAHGMSYGRWVAAGLTGEKNRRLT